ncbi:MAG: hypothetical protein ACREBP_01435 [Sphingomicrobium sp.]
MKATTITRIEGAADLVAAASLAAALGYAVTALAVGLVGFSILPGLAASAIGFAGVRSALKTIDRQTGIAAPVISEVPLLLDDALPQVGPASRVVQLFERQKQPTAGELAARIDRHFAARPQTEAADDSASLLDALIQLRGNLR